MVQHFAISCTGSLEVLYSFRQLSICRFRVLFPSLIIPDFWVWRWWRTFDQILVSHYHINITDVTVHSIFRIITDRDISCRFLPIWDFCSGSLSYLKFSKDFIDTCNKLLLVFRNYSSLTFRLCLPLQFQIGTKTQFLFSEILH